MEYLCILFKLQRSLDCTVAHTRSHKEQCIAGIDRIVGDLCTVSTYHTDKARVIVREHGNAHHRCDNGDIQLFGKLDDLLLCIRCEHASANANKRLFRRAQRLSDALHLKGIAFTRGLIAAYLALFGVLEIHRHLLYVHRHIYQYGTGPSGTCDIESLLEHTPYVCGILQQIAVLNERFDSTCYVSLLKNV